MLLAIDISVAVLVGRATEVLSDKPKERFEGIEAIAEAKRLAASPGLATILFFQYSTAGAK